MCRVYQYTKRMSLVETRVLTFVTRCRTQKTVKPPVAAYQDGLASHSRSLFGTSGGF